MSRMHLTAVVICHRLEHLADMAIASVVNQTRKPDRLVLLGTDCRQETRDCLQAWLDHPEAQRCGVMTAYSKTPLTCTQSKNLAAKFASVPPIGTDPALPQTESAFFTLDADDYLLPFYIQRLMRAMESGQYAGVGCDYLIQNVHGQFYPAGTNDHDVNDVRSRNVMPSCSILKTSVFHEMGGYPEGFAWEDWAFWLTLWFNGHEFCRYPMPLYMHVRHETNKTNADDRLANLAEIDRHKEELESRHAEGIHTMRDDQIRRAVDPGDHYGP